MTTRIVSGLLPQEMVLFDEKPDAFLSLPARLRRLYLQRNVLLQGESWWNVAGKIGTASAVALKQREGSSNVTLFDMVAEAAPFWLCERLLQDKSLPKAMRLAVMKRAVECCPMAKRLQPLYAMENMDAAAKEECYKVAERRLVKERESKLVPEAGRIAILAAKEAFTGNDLGRVTARISGIILRARQPVLAGAVAGYSRESIH